MKPRVAAALGDGRLGNAKRSSVKVLGSPLPSRSSPMTTSHVRTCCWSKKLTSCASLERKWRIQALVSTRITSATQIAWTAVRASPCRPSARVARQLPGQATLGARARPKRSSSLPGEPPSPPRGVPHRCSSSYALYACIHTVCMHPRVSIGGGPPRRPQKPPDRQRCPPDATAPPLDNPTMSVLMSAARSFATSAMALACAAPSPKPTACASRLCSAMSWPVQMS